MIITVSLVCLGSASALFAIAAAAWWRASRSRVRIHVDVDTAEAQRRISHLKAEVEQLGLELEAAAHHAADFARHEAELLELRKATRGYVLVSEEMGVKLAQYLDKPGSIERAVPQEGTVAGEEGQS